MASKNVKNQTKTRYAAPAVVPPVEHSAVGAGTCDTRTHVHQYMTPCSTLYSVTHSRFFSCPLGISVLSTFSISSVAKSLILNLNSMTCFDRQRQIDCARLQKQKVHGRWWVCTGILLIINNTVDSYRINTDFGTI